MAEAEVLGLLQELEHSLRSNPKEKITVEEELVFKNLKGALVDTFLFSGGITSLVTWKVTSRVSYGPRLLYSAGAAFLMGRLACKWFLRSCLNPIIAADGSRMQRELANIMLAKHQQNPSRQPYMNKYLYKLVYPEQVFVDSHPDKAFARWRFRNFYEEISNIEPIEKPPTEHVHRTVNLQRNLSQEAKKGYHDMNDDPLDCILGYSGSSQEVNSGNNDLQSRKTARARKRAHRRHRTRDRAQSAEIAHNEKNHEF